MNAVERLGAKLAWGRVLKMFPAIRRWLPLLAVLGLTATTILRSAGQVHAADSVDFALKLIGLAVSDPQTAMAVVGGAGASYKLVRLLIGCVPRVPPGPGVLVLLSMLPASHAWTQDLTLHALAGGTVNLQAEADAQVTPLVQLEVDAALAQQVTAPELVVGLDLTGLPGESIDISQPTTYRAIEVHVGLAFPLRSTIFALYGEAGFATRLPGREATALHKAARWASVGLRFRGRRGVLSVGIGPDQRLGAASSEAPAEGVQAPAPLRYQVAVTLRGGLDLGAIGPAKAMLVGSAILGIDLSRRWPTLDGGRSDVVRLGMALAL